MCVETLCATRGTSRRELWCGAGVDGILGRPRTMFPIRWLFSSSSVKRDRARPGMDAVSTPPVAAGNRRPEGSDPPRLDSGACGLWAWRERPYVGRYAPCVTGGTESKRWVTTHFSTWQLLFFVLMRPSRLRVYPGNRVYPHGFTPRCRAQPRAYFWDPPVPTPQPSPPIGQERRDTRLRRKTFGCTRSC